jgi:hypothetical protein
MDAAHTTRLIAAAGGDTAFARLLGIEEMPGFQQRVNNWKRRGIPPAVVLEHYEAIKRLERELSRGASAERGQRA